MKRTHPSSRARPRDGYVTVVTDLNGYVAYTFDHLARNRRDALRLAKARLWDGSPDAGRGVLCGRCGVRAWLELAENGMPLMVENDGTPHHDCCSSAGELPLLALEKCREVARRLADTGAVSPHSTPLTPDREAPASAFINASTRECWNILQDGKALLQCFEAMTPPRLAGASEEEPLSGATLEEAWALHEATEVVEWRFAAIASDFFALLESLDKLHRRLHLTTNTVRARTPLEKEEIE